MDFKILQLERHGSTLLVTINRPESLNALNTAFFDEMDYFIANDATRPDISAIIITGVGKAFVAGADIAEMVNKSSEEAEAFSLRGQSTFRGFAGIEVPVIAAINGFALGGGLELALACDFRIASNTARFGQPEVSLGLIPGYAGTQRLPRLVGMGDALFMLTTGEMISATDALRIGLIQKISEPELLLKEVLHIANTIASKGPDAVKLVKFVTRQGYQVSLAQGSQLEAQSFGQLFGKQGTEGMKAFLEKRKPQW